MKTTDQGNKYGKFNLNRNDHQGRNRVEEFPEFNQDLNEERIVASYRPKERIFYYDNSQISMSYGQHNVEKCLVVLFILIVYSASLIYNYYPVLEYLNSVLLVSGGGLDITTSFLYLYFLIKLKSDEIFNKIPNAAIHFADILIIVNFVIKIVTIIIIYVDYSIIGLTAIALFSFKFTLEFYFSVISVKLFMFCPCVLYLQEQSEKMWNWIKYYIFCCELEEPENPDYTKLEDLESFY